MLTRLLARHCGWIRDRKFPVAFVTRSIRSAVAAAAAGQLVRACVCMCLYRVCVQYCVCARVCAQQWRYRLAGFECVHYKAFQNVDYSSSSILHSVWPISRWFGQLRNGFEFWYIWGYLWSLCRRSRCRWNLTDLGCKCVESIGVVTKECHGT